VDIYSDFLLEKFHIRGDICFILGRKNFQVLGSDLEDLILKELRPQYF